MWTVEKPEDNPGMILGVIFGVGNWGCLRIKALCLIHRCFKVFTRT